MDLKNQIFQKSRKKKGKTKKRKTPPFLYRKSQKFYQIKKGKLYRVTKGGVLNKNKLNILFQITYQTKCENSVFYPFLFFYGIPKKKPILYEYSFPITFFSKFPKISLFNI
jgi:hypothetical protein